MLVKQDPCILNNTESFLYTSSCNVDIVECIIFIGKAIPPNKHASFCLLSLFLPLNIHRVHIQGSVDVLLQLMVKEKKTATLHLRGGFNM